MIYKKLALISIVLLGTSVTSGIVNAYTTKNKGLNVGAELSFLNKPRINEGLTEAKGFKKNKVGANLFIGGRFDKNFGAELGYGIINKNKELGRNSANQIVSATHRVRNVYIDVLGYKPINRCADLIGSIGMGRFKSKLAMPSPTAADANFINAANKAKLGLRVGLGAQYNICNCWSTRMMVRYQRGNKHFLKNNTSVSVGAAYSFS